MGQFEPEPHVLNERFAGHVEDGNCRFGFSTDGEDLLEQFELELGYLQFAALGQGLEYRQGWNRGDLCDYLSKVIGDDLVLTGGR